MENENEIWVPLYKLPGYECNANGEIRSIDRTIVYRDGRVFHYKGQKLKPYIDRGGYCCKRLSRQFGNGTKSFKFHRLIWEAFNGPIPEGLVINHKNGIRNDNRLCNLEVCTVQYNVTYGDAIMKRVLKQSKPVLQYDLQGNFIKEWINAQEVERELGFKAVNIHNCCNGFHERVKNGKLIRCNYTQSNGYIWRFKENNIENKEEKENGSDKEDSGENKGTENIS